VKRTSIGASGADFACWAASPMLPASKSPNAGRTNLEVMKKLAPDFLSAARLRPQFFAQIAQEIH
jgi:hypothetical protein